LAAGFRYPLRRFQPPLLERDEVVETARIQQDREATRKQALAYLEGVEGRFGKTGETVKICIEAGSVVQAICDVAEKEKVDLLAMASHGWGGSRRTFYGSVASGVINKAGQPLLLIRARNMGEAG
jgi:nucleotide-binding universal stress UspA family protein